MTNQTVVIGEALIDLIQQEDGRFAAKPGGAPANVAIALARLGVNVSFAGRLSTDKFGEKIRAWLEVEDIDLSLIERTDDPSSLAVASLDSDGKADYSFYLKGTADWGWTRGAFVGLEDKPPAAVVFGSVAAVIEPGASVIEGLATHLWERDLATIVIDLSNVDDLKDWHSVHQNSFAEHFGFVARDFDSWVKRIRADTSIPSDGVYLLYPEGRAVGFIWLDDIDADESRGFVVFLGVTQQQRGRGFGRLLLKVALAHFSRRGYSHTELGVDTENSSGALGLYRDMGFQVMSTTVEHSRPVQFSPAK